MKVTSEVFAKESEAGERQEEWLYSACLKGGSFTIIVLNVRTETLLPIIEDKVRGILRILERHRPMSFGLSMTYTDSTPEAVDAFLADENPKAHEHLVDCLLVHPRIEECIALS